MADTALHPSAGFPQSEALAHGSTVTTPGSAASWGAIVAGGFVASGASLVLLALGAGLGFAAASPLTWATASPRTFTAAASIWLVATQWVASALGGYVSGRLRTRWPRTAPHEVFFRDTAHGLVAWALSTMAMALLLTLTAVSVADRAVAPANAAASSATAYAVDKLFRPGEGAAMSAAAPSGSDPRKEAEHILEAATNGSIPDDDRGYLATLIAATTGASLEASRARVDQYAAAISDSARKAEAATRVASKAASEAAIYTALALLIGAFIAAVAAAMGGRLRDEHPYA
jgi:hypothetical protein